MLSTHDGMPIERASEESDTSDDVGAFDGVDLASRLAPYFPPPVANLIALASDEPTDDEDDESSDG